MIFFCSIMLVLCGASTAWPQFINTPFPHRLLQSQGSTTATGTSNTFNPAISVNGLFLGYATSALLVREPALGGHNGEEIESPDAEHAEEHTHAHSLPENTGLSVQEIEIRLTSVVDAYFKADVILAIPGTEGIEVEEAAITTTSLPNITVKAGKFYGDFGKHNLLHTHAYPFIDPPVVHERLLGGEGLNETGIGASLLLPTQWYSEFTAQIFNGDNDLFNSPKGNDLSYLGHWKNLWDITDNTTFEWGGSYTLGKNEHAEFTQIWGGDLTCKWRKRNRAIVFQTEYLQARVNDGLDTETIGGLYALAQIQMARRWWIQTRYDIFGLPKTEPDREHRLSALLAFVPSEFSALRLQYNFNKEGNQSVHQLALQLNVTLGAHPAHAY